MIEKVIIDGTEHIIAYFGQGLLTVAPAFIAEGGKYGFENRLLVCEHGTGVIGQRNEYLEEGSCTTELRNPIIFDFSNAESIDVVIRALEKIKFNFTGGNR